jgi:hypothetical protein
MLAIVSAALTETVVDIFSSCVAGKFPKIPTRRASTEGEFLIRDLRQEINATAKIRITYKKNTVLGNSIGFS